MKFVEVRDLNGLVFFINPAEINYVRPLAEDRCILQFRASRDLHVGMSAAQFLAKAAE
jgi:hypothetical protein